MKTITTDRKLRRKMRVSRNIRGTADRPRISVYRSSKFIYAQAIDDEKRVTVCSSTSKKLESKEKANKATQAKQTGVALGKALLEKKINKAVFDRGVYTYLGRVKQLAEGLREAGIQI